MPRYDYRCVDCDHDFELVQSFSEAGTGVCPECSGAGRRVFHAVPVIYKGSGFYTTDYGRAKSSGENKDENDSKNGSDESSKSTSDSKSKSETTASSSTSESSSGKSEPASTASTSGSDSKGGASDK